MDSDGMRQQGDGWNRAVYLCVRAQTFSHICRNPPVKTCRIGVFIRLRAKNWIYHQQIEEGVVKKKRCISKYENIAVNKNERK